MEQRKKSFKDLNQVALGFGWNKTIKTKTGSFDVINISAVGGKDTDKFQLCLFNAENNQIIPLNGQTIQLKNVKEKKTETSPDYILAAYLD